MVPFVPFSLLIFDYDGVLIDSLADAALDFGAKDKITIAI
jgi:hypothetical protein